MSREYEVVIIGGGPAGLSAGIYTARARLSSLLVEKGIVGGLVTNAEVVENYPGFPEGISGLELTELMHKQATKFGLETLTAEVTGVELEGKQKIVKTSEGNLTTKALIAAGGSDRVQLNVPGEKEFTGKGVSYCAICDASFFSEQTVAVIGGGNSAVYEALQLAKFASKVIVIHRRDELRATRIVQEKAFAEPKIELLWNNIVERIEGEGVVKRLRLHNVVTGDESTLDVSGVFVSIGFKPNTDYLRGILPLDAAGYIVVNEKMETGIPGIFAAGDIRSGSIRQVVAAAGDGATAAIYAERFIAQ